MGLGFLIGPIDDVHKIFGIYASYDLIVAMEAERFASCYARATNSSPPNFAALLGPEYTDLASKLEFKWKADRHEAELIAKYKRGR